MLSPKALVIIRPLPVRCHSTKCNKRQYVRTSMWFNMEVLENTGAYTEIVIRGGPGVEVEVNVVSAEGVSHYRPRGVWGHAPPGQFLKYLSQMVHYKSILKVIWEQKRLLLL